MPGPASCSPIRKQSRRSCAMPSSSLNVPHFQQELDYACVAACARMVLAHFGDYRSEADLRSLLDTQPTGTRAANLMRLSGPAFEVYLRPSNVAQGIEPFGEALRLAVPYRRRCWHSEHLLPFRLRHHL